MINNYLSIPQEKLMPQGIETGFVTRHETDAVFDHQVAIRFLQQSASYLGVNLSRHELAARYMRN